MERYERMGFCGKHGILLDGNCRFCGKNIRKLADLVRNNYKKELDEKSYKCTPLKKANIIIDMIDKYYCCLPLTDDEWMVKDILE